MGQFDFIEDHEYLQKILSEYNNLLLNTYDNDVKANKRMSEIKTEIRSSDKLFDLLVHHASFDWAEK